MHLKSTYCHAHNRLSVMSTDMLRFSNSKSIRKFWVSRDSLTFLTANVTPMCTEYDRHLATPVPSGVDAFHGWRDMPPHSQNSHTRQNSLKIIQCLPNENDSTVLSLGWQSNVSNYRHNSSYHEVQFTPKCLPHCLKIDSKKITNISKSTQMQQ